MYNQRGFLTQVNNKQTSQPIWELLDVNSKGQPLELSLGNGLHSYHEYDPYGFLYRIGTLTYPSYTYDVQDYLYHFIPEWGRPEQRFNLKGNDEHYYYDEDGSKLNRLSRVTVATHPAENLSMQYFSNGNISSKTGLGTYAYEDPQHLHAVTKVDNTAPLIPETRQDITYTPFNKVFSIIEGDNQLLFTYGTANQRVKTEYYDNDIQKIKYFAGNYEQEIINGNTRELHYIAGPMGLAAIYVKNNGTDSMYYTHTDHLGSITEITDNTGTLLQRMQYDAWGKRSFITNNIGINNFLFDRGYTGHEHLDQFALINMNGRLYDPLLGRMLSPDNYVQNATGTQGFNRYSYAMNNPMVYVDPDGEFVFIPILIGAAIGAYTGYKIADARGYDMGDWQTWGYMAGGAVVGGVSGYLSYAVATSGMAYANTAAIMTGSFTNSVGMSIVSGGQSPVSISFGAASYDITNNEWGYIGKKGNSTLENIGYGLGALANLSDIAAGFHPGDVELRTENSTESQGYKDKIGHTQINKDGEILIDYGPTRPLDSYTEAVPGTNSYERGNLLSEGYDPVQIKGVNVQTLRSYANNLNTNPGNYSFWGNSCTQQASRALNLSGVFNIGLHPYLLQGQMYLRSIGVRPMMYSYNLYQY